VALLVVALVVEWVLALVVERVLALVVDLVVDKEPEEQSLT
jgi:hypothetical protein